MEIDTRSGDLHCSVANVGLGDGCGASRFVGEMVEGVGRIPPESPGGLESHSHVGDVDGENIAAVTVESIMARYPAAAVVSVYAVPDLDVGDQVMLAMQLVEGASFDRLAFERFLSEQPDLGLKAVPRYLRVCPDLPITASNKVLTRVLRREFWECADPVWIREGSQYRPMTDNDIEELRAGLKARGRVPLLEQS